MERCNELGADLTSERRHGVVVGLVLYPNEPDVRRKRLQSLILLEWGRYYTAQWLNA
jgi:hypothetical protein